jgi:hypothetical protein
MGGRAGKRRQRRRVAGVSHAAAPALPAGFRRGGPIAEAAEMTRVLAALFNGDLLPAARRRHDRDACPVSGDGSAMASANLLLKALRGAAPPG